MIKKTVEFPEIFFCVGRSTGGEFLRGRCAESALFSEQRNNTVNYDFLDA